MNYKLIFKIKKIKTIANLTVIYVLSVNMAVASVTVNALWYDGNDKNSAKSVNKHARNNYKSHLKKKKTKKFKPDKQKPVRYYHGNSCYGF